MKVRMWNFEDGTPVFQAGEVGTPHPFDHEDEDSVAVAFTKAVNDIIELREPVEGEAAEQVAVVIKDAGAVMWAEDGGYEDLKCEVAAALPKSSRSNGAYNMAYENGSDYYVKDIALDARHALICGWADGEQEHWVVPFDYVSDQVVIGDKSTWVEVEEQFVAKAGRMFSARNLSAMEEAHEALGKLIAAGKPRQPDESDAEADGEEATTKALGDLSYTVQKTTGAMRYTLGPLYAPMRKDAHGEWIEDESLHKALHEFVRMSADDGRRINLQHGDKGDIQVGEWVEAMRWPYEHTITLKAADGTSHEVTMPEGTVYLGVVWDEDYWDEKANAPKGINGYSLGGRAIKMRDAEDAPALEAMGYKVAKHTDSVVPDLPEPTAKMTKHDYVGDGDTCKVCDMSMADGNHNEVKKDASGLDYQGLRDVLMAEDRRHREEIAMERERADAEAARVTELVEAVKAVLAAPKADVHVHVPEQVVNIGTDAGDDKPEG